MESAQLTTLILVRHGETAYNLEHRFTGWLDVTLSARGIEQARRVADYIASNYQAQRLYCSPLLRAMQTANAIGDACGLTPAIIDGLKERSLGQLEGRAYAEGTSDVDRNGALPGGETAQVFWARVLFAMKTLIKENRGHTAIVVSHGGSLAIFLADLVEGRTGCWEKFLMENGGLTVVTIAPGRLVDFRFDEFVMTREVQ